MFTMTAVAPAGAAPAAEYFPPIPENEVVYASMDNLISISISVQDLEINPDATVADGLNRWPKNCWRENREKIKFAINPWCTFGLFNFPLYNVSY